MPVVTVSVPSAPAASAAAGGAKAPAPKASAAIASAAKASAAPAASAPAASAPAVSAPAAAKGPKSQRGARGGGNGGDIPTQLSAMESRITGKIDARFESLNTTITTGFAQQQQTLHDLQAALTASQIAMQNSFQGLANAMTTALTSGGSSSRRELPAPAASARHSSVLEICDAPRGGSGSTSSPSDRVTGTTLDQLMSYLASIGLLVDGDAYNCIALILSPKGLSDHYRQLLPTIAQVVMNSQISRFSGMSVDTIVAFFFLLLTGCTQFRRSDFQLFRNSCEALLEPSNHAQTFQVFSQICDKMVEKNPMWQIVTKRKTVLVANSMLATKRFHSDAFVVLVRNFQS